MQHEFGHGITSEVAYVGKHGADMQFKGDINQVPVQNLSANDNPGGRPYPQYQSIGGSTFNAVSNYNSLQAQVKKRLAQRHCVQRRIYVVEVPGRHGYLALQRARR